MKRLSVLLTICLAAAGALPAAADVPETPLSRALTTLAERLAETPRDAGLLTDYANLLVRAGRIDEARAHYETAVEIAPESVMALYNLGLLELELGRPQAAVRLFRRSVRIDPAFARGEFGLGMALETLDRNPKAVAHYARSFRLDPGLRQVNSNPELLFSRLVTWATMRDYLETSLGRGTRVYADPAPIVGLLVPSLEEVTEATEGEPTPSDEPRPAEGTVEEN